MGDIPTDGVLLPTDGVLLPTDGVLLPMDGVLLPTDGVLFPSDSSMEKSKAEARNKLSALSAMVSGIKASDFQVAKRIAKIASDIADANDIADASTLSLFAKIEKIEADIKALLANL